MGKQIRKQKKSSIIAGGFFRLGVYLCVAIAVIYIGKSAYDFGYEIFNQEAVATKENGRDITVVLKKDDSVYQIGKILKKQRKPAILVTHDISEAISMADRVLILSKRPANVIKIVPIDLDMKDRTPLASRNAPAFKSYFNLIWKELNQNA